MNCPFCVCCPSSVFSQLLPQKDKAECIRFKRLMLNSSYSCFFNNSIKKAVTIKQANPVSPGQRYFSDVSRASAFLPQCEKISELYTPGFGKDFDGILRATSCHRMTFIACNSHKNKGCNYIQVRSPFLHHRVTQFCHIYLTGFSCPQEKGQLVQVKVTTVQGLAQLLLLVCFPFSQ